MTVLQMQARELSRKLQLVLKPHAHQARQCTPMSTTSMSHLFSRAGQAESYAKFRPNYAASGLFDALDAFAGPPQLSRALDVATGAHQHMGWRGHSVTSAQCMLTLVPPDKRPGSEQLSNSRERTGRREARREVPDGHRAGP